MMRVFILFSVIILLVSCGEKRNEGIYDQGRLEYKIKYLNAEEDNYDPSFLPKKMVLEFNQDFSINNIDGFMGFFKLGNMTSFRSHKVKTYLKVLDKSYAFIGGRNDMMCCFDCMDGMRMIEDTVRYLKSQGMTVFLDAEHYFDGYNSDPDYALQCVKAGADAGADCIVLCETNGGALPDEVEKAVKAAKKATNVPLGIHTHNDAGLAVANTLVAVKAGVSHVQGTINGYGERTGNANLCSIIPSLKLKMNIDCISDEQLSKLTEVSHYVSELANQAPAPYAPYVGSSAFSHKAGYHMDGMQKWPEAYQHIDPAKVGNQQRTVVSELSGKRIWVSSGWESNEP